jgi:glucose/arabinose dehydrogenase
MFISTLIFTQHRQAVSLSTGSIAALLFAAGTTLFALSTVQAQQPAAPAAPKAPDAAQMQKSSPALAPPGAATAPPPTWQQGRSAEQANSPLHPLAPILTGRLAKELPLDKLKVPAGFKVEVWVDGVPEARALALGDKGTVFAGNRNLSDVYAIVDKGGKREVKKIVKGLASPNGVLFNKGTLYVAEKNRIVRYDGIEDKLDNPPAPKVVIDGLPEQCCHFWKVMTLGPDGKIYFNIGAPGNIVMPSYIQAAIVRVNPSTGKMEDYVRGVRQSVGMAFNPKTKQLWFTANNRDWLSEDGPSDILGVVKHQGEHFGYPYCHQGDTPDPEYGKYRSCSEFTPPALKLGAHMAPLGMRFYTGKMFPAEYQNSMFIAEHGSWNKSVKQGYNVINVRLDASGKPTSKPFLEGFLTDPKADPPMWGRPVDVQELRDGSLLVSDDYNGVIYRISYKK